ncbi:SusD/RagB family nutrient-binding outer membrane lipoprotein [Daejeonella sp.]|uniref:SusD/RagB family nutrient-binding outer membrane lipoprotein n=1 Tax=Daejeonella sp. TaxID=2805397 RepID=UPI0025BE2CD1|nr:SusD/RagB family nutrient-binding outer membrane lipoprotein [Daejeonella sp.]
MKNKLIYGLAFLMVFGMSSCEKLSDFGDTNVNPAATTEPNAPALLTNSLAGLGGWTTSRQLGYYSQYFSETQYPSVSLYALPQASFSGNYSGTLYDLQNIIGITSSKNMAAVSEIVKQFIFWQMTDRWGDIPYSQALKGIEVGKPKYDKQEDIYKGMIKALTDAVAAFDGSPINGDILYNGNVDSWKRAANSMRMLMAIQLSKKYPAADGYAATEFKAALAANGGYISTNDQNFKVKYAAPNYKSPIWGWYNGRADDAESKTMTDMLSSLSDARINVYGGDSHTGGTGTSTVGAPYGLNESKSRAFVNANAGWARVLRGDFRTEGSTVFLITAAQVALARAEAANLGWTTESASTAYTQGITLSFTQWGLAAPSSSYLNGTEVALGTDNVKKIATQQWIASYPDGHMGWNVWRKTGFPVLTPAPDAVNTSKQIVRRFTYAAAEYTNNPELVKEAVDRLPGGDKQDSKVWWDQ